MSEHNAEACFSRRENGVCWVCLEDTYGSTIETVMLHCNHIFHRKCIDKLLQSDEYRCPACKKSVGDMKEYWVRIDSYMELNKIPEEFEKWESFCYCNDCQVKFWTKYHFIYHKCEKCKGYNTYVLQVDNKTNL